MKNLEHYLAQFDPHRNVSDWVVEDPNLYAERMQASFLPNWPKEVLIDWLYQHARCLDRYAHLKFERFKFERQRWTLSRIPGREAFDDPGFCDAFENIEERAKSSFDWLAKYMIANGTWNAPIILLDNPNSSFRSLTERGIRSPLHLLEGHRRLSFLNGLRRLNMALPEHDVWLVRVS